MSLIRGTRYSTIQLALVNASLLAVFGTILTDILYFYIAAPPIGGPVFFSVPLTAFIFMTTFFVAYFFYTLLNVTYVRAIVISSLITGFITLMTFIFALSAILMLPSTSPTIIQANLVSLAESLEIGLIVVAIPLSYLSASHNGHNGK